MLKPNIEIAKGKKELNNFFVAIRWLLSPSLVSLVSCRFAGHCIVQNFAEHYASVFREAKRICFAQRRGERRGNQVQFVNHPLLGGAKFMSLKL
jgi:hypothetical protein